MNGHELHTDIKILFSRIAQGDEMAFEEVFHEYVPRLMPVIVKIVGSESAAKDVLQEVFLYLWIGRESLSDVQNPADWIFKIAFNRSYTWVKKSSKVTAQSEIGIEEIISPSHQPEQSLAFQETRRLLYLAAQELPPQAKKIFQLSREEGLKPAAIAIELNVSVQTVRNSLVRSVKFIKKYLARKGVVLPASLLLYLLK